MIAGRLGRIMLALVAPLVLASCLFAPGRFTSHMDVAADGRFDFAYKGEIVFIGYAELMKERARSDASKPDNACRGPLPVASTEGDVSSDRDGANRPIDAPRPCTAEEKAARSGATKRRSEETATFQRVFGIDPDDPRALEQFAEKLRRQDGWISVVYKGEGVFDVAYATSGKLDRDFIFPVYPGTAATFPMIVASPEADGNVRISAPGLAGSGGMGGMATAVFGLTSVRASGAQPASNGSFIVNSRAEILTNNTEDGPTTGPNGRQMVWTIRPVNDGVPETLLKVRR